VGVTNSRIGDSGADAGTLTRVLERVAAGRESPDERLLPLVYDELRGLAQRRMAALPPGQTLQPTALVHEAFLKLVGGRSLAFEGRAHFFGAAARAMRNVLVDEARRRAGARRGGDRARVPIDDVEPADSGGASDPAEIIALHEALGELEREDPRMAQLVSLRTFVGLSQAEAAETLGVSLATANRDWRYAKAWLGARLAGRGPRP